MRTALGSAETGHLVFSTPQTLDATETVTRIIDFFPPHLQQQARVRLAATVRGGSSASDSSAEPAVPAGSASARC